MTSSESVHSITMLVESGSQTCFLEVSWIFPIERKSSVPSIGMIEPFHDTICTFQQKLIQVYLLFSSSRLLISHRKPLTTITSYWSTKMANGKPSLLIGSIALSSFSSWPFCCFFLFWFSSCWLKLLWMKHWTITYRLNVITTSRNLSPSFLSCHTEGIAVSLLTLRRVIWPYVSHHILSTFRAFLCAPITVVSFSSYLIQTSCQLESSSPGHNECGHSVRVVGPLASDGTMIMF